MSPCHGPDGVDCSREEAWVLHAAVLDHAERVAATGRAPDRAVAVLDRIEACDPLDATDIDLVRIEACDPLDATDIDLVRDALSTYLDGAPARDRDPAREVLATLSTRQASSSQ